MTALRITQQTITQHSLTSLQQNLAQLSRTQEQISTGKAINRPSDDPLGTEQALRLRSQIAANNQYTANAQDAQSWLGQTDSTLTSMTDDVRRARDLIVQASNTGSLNPGDRSALAAQLQQIRTELIGQANTQIDGRPLFGGTTGSSSAYTDAASADGTPVAKFQGDEAAVNRTIGQGVDVQVNVTGRTTFTDPSSGKDLFTVIQDAVDQIKAGAPALSDSLANLDAVQQQMSTVQTTVGARENQVQSALDTLSTTTLQQKSQLSDVQDVDLAQAVMDLQMQQISYQASLSATSKVLQPSLMDFLR